LYRLKDPRWYQICVLSLLLGYGIAVLDFGIRWPNAIAIFASAQFAQFIGIRLFTQERFDPLSALITSFSLTLLLRTDVIGLTILAAIVAIGSKFLVRVNGKHVFNPANVALVSLMLLSDKAWVSSGQWGSAAIGAFALACLGFLVLTRAKRAETTLAFMVAFAGLLLLRALWLGDPLNIPLHQISDPKTSPNSARGRIIYGALVACVAYSIQFIFYEPNGPILALIMSAPLVPLIDSVARGPIYRWEQPAGTTASQIKGV
jgi:Na+-transporting NADH:ubiquinone oxidoreductase subunit NqrB